MKYIPGIIALVVIAAGAGYWWMHKSEVQTPAQTAASDPKNASYVIDGVPVMLVNGSSQIAQENSSAPITTTYFGNDATVDLNGDGVPDTAFLLTQNSGGSGTFYYVAAYVSSPSGYRGTNAALLGDRIAPQTTEIQNSKIIVNFADRNPSEPMTAQPSV